MHPTVQYHLDVTNGRYDNLKTAIKDARIEYVEESIVYMHEFTRRACVSLNQGHTAQALAHLDEAGRLRHIQETRSVARLELRERAVYGGLSEPTPKQESVLNALRDMVYHLGLYQSSLNDIADRYRNLITR